MDEFQKPMRMLPIKGAPWRRPERHFTFDVFRPRMDSDSSSGDDDVFEPAVPLCTPLTPSHPKQSFDGYEDEDDSGSDSGAHEETQQTEHTALEEASDSDRDDESEQGEESLGVTSADEEVCSESGLSESDTPTSGDSTPEVSPAMIKTLHRPPETDSEEEDEGTPNPLPAVSGLGKRKPTSSTTIEQSSAKKTTGSRTCCEDKSHIMNHPPPTQGNDNFNWPWID
ncbi:hypothetical protein RHVP.45 [Cricetid gammaherpesvirus 2]|uniref:Tegument protein G45 n=1 Tax=Cricetid gammaherpesvirus 2 TaxID=1605972 RepID=E9M5M8_9GAMA|nr:hypothetical protein RHVP.45 [Cricetid gammaherpesvirus 2]ADW24386.1 hypothetical protein RHVP.45 [Cricetid gammaherpesvirus 2]ADW24468.1 hypothetical protein RHVP-L.45 [Cricetid gammaherpesvirus 2]